MRPRFAGRLGIADAVTAANAGVGFVAVVAATVDPELAARLVLLAAIADGLDGLLARRYGGTAAGEHLDSLADVASFSVAPAFVVVTLATNEWGYDGVRSTVAVGVGALFVAAGVVRLGMYTAYDTGNDHTEGVPTTLAATLLAAGVLAGVTGPTVVVASAAVLCLLMVSTVTYPDLYPRDALAMGTVQAGAVLVPVVFSRVFPRALLAWAVAYLALAPQFYWRTEGKRS
ncbi:protein sorting system archaetidylserine synthase [Halobacterium zhouii]|uniref:protein sorting system archaetidylserine synthase n=1 Tax=Halobacterium zhouii TaxID=2902624 RepID=UPI001E3797FD|nr:protein sorting system archaetidylserine synthase [Halobacterium zhouii]